MPNLRQLKAMATTAVQKQGAYKEPPKEGEKKEA
jgi:hypothetical protein